MDVLVMENLLFGRNVTRLYDLKGSSRSRYNSDSSGNNKVLLDQNLIEAMPTSPIFVGNKAKRLLERAVWNDTAFLAVSLQLSLLIAASLASFYFLIVSWVLWAMTILGAINFPLLPLVLIVSVCGLYIYSRVNYVRTFLAVN